MSINVKKWLGWTLLILMLLLLLIRLSIPYAIQHAFSNMFQQHGVTAQIGAVKLGLIDGNLSLDAVTAEKDGAQVLALQSLMLEWSWSGVLNNHASLISLRADGLMLHASEREGMMTVAGITLATDTTQASDDAVANNAPPAWLASVGDIRFTATRLCYASDGATEIDHCIEAEDISWDGDIHFDLASMDAEALPISIQGRFELLNINVQDRKRELSPLRFRSLALDGILVDTPADIRLGSASLEELELLQRSTDEPASNITSLASLLVEDIALQDLDSLTIARLTLKDHQLFLLRREDASLELSDWLPNSINDQNAADSNSETTQSATFNISLGQFIYQSDKNIIYTDNSLADPFTARLSSIELMVSNIDTQQPQQSSAISFKAQYHDHGVIELAGDATLLTEKKSINIDGSIKGMDLRDISSFTKSTIGYSIKSGQLDSDISFKADNNILDSKLNLHLHQFELKALSKEDKEKMERSMGLPLSSSLALLRDSDNTISLQIPITGDLDAPDFNPADAINKATSKAITFAVINYYTPFGLVLAADGLLSLATGLKFDSVEFAAGETEADSSAYQQLNKILPPLNERPGVRLTLCGFSGKRDAVAILNDYKAGADDTPSALSEPQKKKLLALAEQRAAWVKQYLVGQSVAADRLILCAPEYDNNNDAGHVDISI